MKNSLIFSMLFVSSLFLACDDDNNSNNANNVNNVNNVNNTNNVNNINNVNNTNNPQLLSFDDSGCKNGADQKAIDWNLFSGFECVTWSYDGTGALELRHINAVFNCCPGDPGMSGTVAFADGVFTLTESDNGGMCNCVCPYDMIYQLTNVAPGAYSVVVNPFEAPVVLDLSAAVEDWFCVDRLLNSMIAGDAGERGSFCETSATCMGGDGYCYEPDEYTAVCVNSCETAADCPIPELEECIEDANQVLFCHPTTDFSSK